MISIKLYDPESKETKYYEKQKIDFGEFKKVLKFNKDIEQEDIRRKILNIKLESKSLTKSEEAELLSLTGNDDERVEKIEKLVAELFKNPKVTVATIDAGLNGDGLQTLRDILADAMGGVEADADHPAKK